MATDDCVTRPLDFVEYPPAEMLHKAQDFSELMWRRRTVRDFSDRPVDVEIIHHAIKTACSAPSGANKQPWHFVVISNAEIKRAIREAAEEEERAFYGGRASESWLDDLKKFGTDANKPFLETAPYLIAVFLQRNSFDEEGNKHKNYYMPESVGIASGMLLAALHNAGLATLTHTPSPMGFLSEILQRPSNEKPYLLVVAGYPEDGAQVPAIDRKPFDEVCTRFE
ncbi:MAG: nitroreductase family protein [Cellvibrionaceae bacterium]|nr:nitroreductase family protein [Cellvibrionaceae bacterium]